MRTSDSLKPRPQTRRDGWTLKRQLLFIQTLSRTRSVTRAAASVGMSRESAYRLRKRDSGGLFTAAWAFALEGHAFGKPATEQRKRNARISRGNPPKVTKLVKLADPRFNALEKLLRDFRAGAV